ncbi:hypothetical protein [Mesobacillus zeae]|uniref:hypothetical protein n=1 Tax=Mesobacillus zeae TaxID=1917180 RepID=UPI00300900D5
MRRELDENQRDLRRIVGNYDELIVERRKLWAGIYGIEAELDELKWIKGAD